MKAELITIGDEILLGKVINTNTAYIGDGLARIGVRLVRQIAIPDDREVLADTIGESLKRSSVCPRGQTGFSAVAETDVVITTGGLGPTRDDPTKAVLTEFFRTKLVRDEAIVNDLRRRYGDNLPALVLTQAEVPESAFVISNSVGTAPGFIFEEGGKMVVALPGPPNELKPMFESVVIPRLKSARTGELFVERIFKTIAIREVDIEEKVGKLLEGIPGLSYGLIAHPHQVDIRLFCTSPAMEEADRILTEGEKVLDKEFGKSIFTKDDRPLEQVVGEMLRETGKTIAVAESCTGGLISRRITDISGSSDYFEGAFVSYSNRWKENLLGVSRDTLLKHGAVSEESARQMAENVREKAGTDIGLAVTGIAGPTGGTKQKPVGLVYMALSDGEKTIARKFNFRGDRESIRYRASQAALNMVREYILELPSRRSRQFRRHSSCRRTGK